MEKSVYVYTSMFISWCQEGWHDIYFHVWPRSVPRTVLAVALLREDARAVIYLKAIECLAGHVSYLACPLRCIILFCDLYTLPCNPKNISEMFACVLIYGLLETLPDSHIILC